LLKRVFGTQTHNFLATLSFISKAALFVKVTIKIEEGFIQEFIIFSTLIVRVAVFQLQAQAKIKRGQSILSIASCCFGFACIYSLLII
jgi:hypothetical protein